MGQRAAPAPRRLGLVGLLVVWAGLLFLLPATLVVRPVGAPGTPANGLALVLLVLWVALTIGRLNPVRGWTPVRVSALVLTVSVLVSYASAMAWGWYASPGVRQVTDELWTLVQPTPSAISAKMVSAADRGLLSFFGWMGVMLMMAEGLRSWADVDRVVTWIVRFATVVAGIGIVAFVTGVNVAAMISVPGLSPNFEFGTVDTRSVLNRVAGTATHPIEFGVVLAAVLPLAVHRTIHHWGRISAAVPTVVIAAACAMSVSRSAVLVAGVALGVMFLGWPWRWKWRALLLAPAGVVALRLAVPGLVGTLISLFTNLFNDNSISGRTSDYGVVLEVWGEHPFVGRGLFTFLPRYYRILDNQVLMVMLELGIVGLLALAVLHVSGFVSARCVRRDADTPEHRHLGLALSGSVAGLTLSLFTYDAWGYAMATGLGFALFGLVGACLRLSRRERRTSEPGFGPRPEQAHAAGAPA